MNKDLTVGKPSQVLWQFCLPMFGSIIFQQLYNIADSLVAGKFIGENALAAVGNSYEITLIFIAFAFGCNIGCSVIVSRYFGAKEYDDMKTSVYTALIGSAVLCAALMVFGLLGCRSLLELINTPEEILADSALYLDIYVLGLPFMFFYNIATGIFSALGDSKTPFYFLAVSSLSNIGVDILFVAGFHMGVAGVAWATFLCQGVSCILAMVVVFRRMKAIPAQRKTVWFSWNMLGKIAVVALMSSFGPVIALANLGTGLQNTFAAGNRVLDVLDEQPTVREVTGGEDIAFTGAACRRVTFGYGSDVILNDVSLEVPQNSVIGITGRSGSGKSTLLKLMMRFWDTDLGKVELSGVNIKKINTASLRSAESFVEQDTVLFHDSIEENVKIANRNATHEQVVAACRKASIHDFIMTLPQGYNTPVGELGDTLSGGERQRLGVARAFLHDAPFILLDEPTSNLDSLNEAVILRSLAEERASKTVVLVSHRTSTMRIADTTYSVENGRMS